MLQVSHMSFARACAIADSGVHRCILYAPWLSLYYKPFCSGFTNY